MPIGEGAEVMSHTRGSEWGGNLGGGKFGGSRGIIRRVLIPTSLLRYAYKPEGIKDGRGTGGAGLGICCLT